MKLDALLDENWKRLIPSGSAGIQFSRENSMLCDFDFPWKVSDKTLYYGVIEDLLSDDSIIDLKNLRFCSVPAGQECTLHLMFVNGRELPLSRYSEVVRVISSRFPGELPVAPNFLIDESVERDNRIWMMYAVESGQE